MTSTATTATLDRLSRDIYSDLDGVLATLATLRFPNRIPVRAARLAIMARRPFSAGNMAAGAYTYWARGEGRLPRDWRKVFADDTADGGAYIVYSYQTPIAWERSDGLRVVPPVSYSVSTARHQGEVRSAWGMRWGQTYSHPTRSMDTL